MVLAVFLDLFMQFPTIAPYAESLGASAAIAGIAVAAYSFTNMFGNLGAGPLLDRLGRRGPMIAGMAISAAAVLGYSLVQTPAQLMAARAIHGLGAAVLAPGAFSIVGDRAPSDRRGQAMGFTGALIALAALAGPPAAGILRDASGADAVFMVDAAILLATLAVFILATRGESLDSASAEPASVERRGPAPRGRRPQCGRRAAQHSPSPWAWERWSLTCPCSSRTWASPLRGPATASASMRWLPCW